MMNAKFNEEDIEICNEGISVNNSFFDKKRIADTFNELLLLRDFFTNMEKQYDDI